VSPRHRCHRPLNGQPGRSVVGPGWLHQVSAIVRSSLAAREFTAWLRRTNFRRGITSPRTVVGDNGGLPAARPPVGVHDHHPRPLASRGAMAWLRNRVRGARLVTSWWVDPGRRRFAHSATCCRFVQSRQSGVEAELVLQGLSNREVRFGRWLCPQLLMTVAAIIHEPNIVAEPSLCHGTRTYRNEFKKGRWTC
jgi:hypothetical protein